MPRLLDHLHLGSRKNRNSISTGDSSIDQSAAGRCSDNSSPGRAPARLKSSGMEEAPQSTSRGGTMSVDRREASNASESVPCSDRVPRREVPGGKHGAPASQDLASRGGSAKTIIDKLRNTEGSLATTGSLPATSETHIRETIAPAVTDETVYQHTHEIRQERITREIHTHEVHHRILPITDVEIRPARHFVSTKGGLVEVPASQIPGREGAETLIAAVVEASREVKTSTPLEGSRQFTARPIKPNECRLKERLDPDNVVRSEVTHIHSPKIETGAQETGQTMPLLMNPLEDDSNNAPQLRLDLPTPSIELERSLGKMDLSGSGPTATR